MCNPIEEFKMETNFEGLIQLLAKHLYHEPEIFIRELLQNSHDSIQRRRREEIDLSGFINIDYDPNSSTLTFSDNGIGMNKSDIKEFLAVIGSTGTGRARKMFEKEGVDATYEMIGQFGIGMLSAFVVAEKVIVHTLKLGETEAFAWHNSGSTDCKLFTDTKNKTGTDIVVYIQQDYNYLFNEKRLRDIIVKYCDFLSFPICLNGQGPVNTIDAPWHRIHWPHQAEKDATYHTFLSRRYPDIPLDIIPIEINEPYRAYGLLYISDRHVPDVDTAGVVDIYVRRMFIRGNDNTFLPPWAKFVRGIIDCPDLQPTAARDNVQRNEKAFEFLQKKIGDLIVERLTYLAQNDQSKFERINLWHHYHLKGMAKYYDDFFDQVIDLLLFETNQKLMSLKEYLTKNSRRPETNDKIPIYYFAYQDASTQFNNLANARGWVVINAGRIFDKELLVKYAKKNHRTIHLERLDASDDLELLIKLNKSDEEKFRQLEIDMESYLRRFDMSNVVVRTRSYSPELIPGIIILTAETEAEEKLQSIVSQPWFMEGLSEITEETLKQRKRRPIYLYLNSDNQLIQKLAEIDVNRHDRLVQNVMLGVYNSAILYSHNLLTQHNVEAMHKQFVELLIYSMDYRIENDSMRKILENERSKLNELLDHQAEQELERPEHILIFMITPFSEEYKAIEEAVRRIFECPPYFFEIRLARDYTHKPGLLDNVREHMRRAHGFVAEISELNPNVMIELGAAMLPDDGRPVFSLKSNDSDQPMPADLKEKLRIQYGSLKEPIEIIESQIRSELERDGRPTHDGILALMNQRKKKFLSRTMIDGLKYAKLQQNEVEKLLKNYITLEDLVDAPPNEVASITGLKEFIIPPIQGELKEQQYG